VAIAVLVGVPVTFAVLHKGFPVTDVNLDTRDVWVTNGEKLLGGRLNHQINELDAAVSGASSKLDVLQDSKAYFLTDLPHGVVERIDPAYVSLVDRITVPADSQVSYGGDTLAVLSPAGQLWVLDASGHLNFDRSKTKPTAKLGIGSQVVVSKSGSTFAISPTAKKLYTVDHAGSRPATSSLAPLKHYQLSAVGDQPVVLDTASNTIVKKDGSTVALPSKGIRIQQAGDDNDYVLVASGAGLMRVPLGGGKASTVSAGISSGVTSSKDVSAPVWLNGCAYGAWAGASRYLYACDGKKPASMDIDQPVKGDDLEFRVNHDVIALNNLRDGNAWVVSSNMQLVQNWAMLKPNQTTVEGDTGEEKPVLQSFEDTLAQRTANNRPPIAVDDTFGVRPGRTTVLPVLSNDTDPDGDVLTITDVSAVPEEQGSLDLVDGGRAVQFTPAKDATGTVSFRYTVDDGRGGVASAKVDAAVHPLSENAAPVSTRSSTANGEVGQSVAYNVLTDWIDPDGDGIYLLSAASTTEDDVQFTPDGLITFTSKTGQTGSKEVKFTVSDGNLSATGSLIITVRPSGSLDPVAVPDFAGGFVGAPVTVHPLDNDTSPSGDPLTLVGATLDSGGNASVVADAEHDTVTVNASAPGEYYLKYTLGAGAKTTVGLIRVNIEANGVEDAPPVAVQDTAYVRPGESTTVSVLDNDVSPSGRVLAVRAVTKSAEASDLNVEVLDNAVVKITAPTVLSKQVQLEYTVSDGPRSATTGITVVPIAPLVNHQPPIATDDTVTVRAGDIASASVLDNDYSPDNEPFTLDPKLRDTSGVGDGATAFVSGKLVRYQAPKTAGQHSVTYGITDKFGQKAEATVTFVVTAPDKGHDRAPEPQTLTARAFAGSAIPVTVPLDGIDPDGDSVTLDGLASQPSLGRIASSTSTSFTYEAYPASAGTDTFTYRVKDTYGKTSVGTVNVAVIKRADTSQPPIAVNDTVEVKPGKTASVPVLNNDSDPNGYTIALQKKLLDIDDGLKAHVHGKFVLVEAPATEGVYVVRYQITNGQGGVDSAFVQVIVDKNAKPQYPTAVDQVLEPDAVADKSSVKVNPLTGATNPSGLVTDLKISVSGANSSAASVAADGSVTVRPGDSRMAITYALTDPTTGLAANAFIIVPPKGDESAPPRIKPGLAQQIVEMGGSKSWKLSDIIDVPSGRSAKLTGASGTSATNSNGQSPYQNDQTLSFTGAKGYRGPAAVTFRVDDGHDAGQTKDRVTLLVLPLTVGSPDQSDVPPTFTPPNEQIQAGEQPITVDLRSSSFHPNPQVLNALTYTGFNNPSSDIQASLSGSKLTISAPLGVQPGVAATLTFTVSSGKYTINGSVNVKVVSSTRPLASQKNAPQKQEIQRGKTTTLSSATGSDDWINPFPGQPLTITKATQVNGPKGVTVTNTGSSITVSAASGADIGVVSVQYQVQDATKDPKRVATGQYQVTIHDVPAQPKQPTAKGGDRAATVTLSQAPADNGKAIDQYRIKASGASDVTTTKLGAVSIPGLTNGQAYSFTVEAHNADGWSIPSAASAPVTPYGTPEKVQGLNIAKKSDYANASFTLSWSALSGAATGGGSVTYSYSFNGGAAQTTTGTSVTTAAVGAGSYHFTVYAHNDGGGANGPVATSGSADLKDPPPPDPSASVLKGIVPNSSYGSGYGACIAGGYHFVGASYSNVPAGDYKLTPLLGGGTVGSDFITVHLSGSGTVSTHGCVGNPGSASVQVKFEGGGLTFYATISGAGWNGLGVNSGIHP
jgi:hypothetical protein